MNKAHRDRVAFMRIVSGKFDKDMEVLHVQNNRTMRLSQPQQIMANDREVISEAFAGDIMGVFDPGVFSIGDTLCSPKESHVRGYPDVRAGAFRTCSPQRHSKTQAIHQGYYPDSAGGRDTDILRAADGF